MKKRTNNLTALAAAFFVMFAALFASDAAFAQTKKKPRKPATKTQTPQPVPTQTQPEIISQADLYTNQNQQIVTGTTETPLVQIPTETPAQPETLDEKLDRLSTRMKEMNTRMKSIEASKQNEYDERQRRLLLNLDILTRAEQRAESLRKQLFELIEKENQIRTKLETIDYDSRPEMIERQIALIGSLRPEELRDSKRKSLETEKRNLTTLLTDIQTTRQSLDQNVQKADQLVEKLRAVLEKDIDDALNAQPDQN